MDLATSYTAPDRRPLGRLPRDARTFARMAAKKRSTNPTRPGLTRMGALRRVDAAKWEREIRKAMKAAEGRVPEAAEALEVSARTLFLWLEEERFADVERASVGAPRKG